MPKNETEYILVRDDDGHWYVIPDKNLSSWCSWLNSEDYENGVIPEYAKEVGGSQTLVKFKNWRLS
jgi:hypothetical protein